MTEITPRELLDEAANAGRRRALIVTALPLEMEAVLAHLADAVSTRGDAGAVYEAGLFRDADEEWLIVVCVTGAGTHPAEMVAIEAHYDFDGFDVQMVVGVAGSRKPTAPIGSVIVADQVYNPYSGKASEGTWSVRPRAIQANYRLVELARAVCRKKEVARTHRWTPGTEETTAGAGGHRGRPNCTGGADRLRRSSSRRSTQRP